jgi:glyoxylase-like metal-dependent hydrolase (beta-lactamase superfamily II)
MAGAMTLCTNLDHLHAIELPTPFPVGPVTVFLADAPGEPLTLIDTGPLAPDARRALEDGLAGLGYAPADLECVILTHAHVDHIGLAQELVAASGAKVLSHRWNTAALGDYEADRERRVSFYGELLRQAAVPAEMMQAVNRVTRGMRQYAGPVALDVPLEDGDRLRLAGREWQVLHTPGHAGGLVCLYEPASGTLLSSDHLLASISSNPVVEPPAPGQTERARSLAMYRDSLHRVAALGVARALPSHGPVIDDVAALVERRLEFHERRMARVVEALRDGARTTWDVTLALFPGRAPMDTFLAISEVIGHLDVLEMDGRVVGEEVGGVIVWRLAGP